MIPSKLNRNESSVLGNGKLSLRFYQMLDAIIDYISAPLSPTTELAFSDSPYSVIAPSQTLICDCTLGNIIINLPSIAIDTGFNVVKSDASANTVTINSADGIIGSGSYVLNAQYDSVKLIAGSNEFYKI